MGSARDILRLCRPGDWTKNSFVLLAFIFWAANAVRTEPAEVVRSAAVQAVLAVAAFCLVASGFYCVNDAIDAERDRAHPVKCRRPVASGAVSRGFATGFGLALVAASFALGFWVDLGLGAAVAGYIVLQLAYNAGLKRIAFVDVMTIASGFALRSAAGALAIDVHISVWLVLCVFFLCLYLGFIKRMCDLVAAERSGSVWKSPAGYRGREELQWLLGLSAVMTVMMYLSYTLSDHATSIFHARATGLALLTPLVIVAIHRFWRRANEGSSDSPLDALKADPVVLASILFFTVMLAVILFVPAAEQMIEVIFLRQGGGPAGLPEGA
jgi:4-hydroxybenzoate polyprenyltransferase